MEELIRDFAIWLVIFLAIYAVVFVFVKRVLRRYVFPYKKTEEETPPQPSGDQQEPSDRSA